MEPKFYKANTYTLVFICGTFNCCATNGHNCSRLQTINELKVFKSKMNWRINGI